MSFVSPYRAPAEMPEERGPRWGVTRLRRLVVRVLRWNDGDWWTLKRQHKRLIAKIERMRLDIDRDQAQVHAMYERLGGVAKTIADKETR